MALGGYLARDADKVVQFRSGSGPTSATAPTSGGIWMTWRSMAVTRAYWGTASTMLSGDAVGMIRFSFRPARVKS